MTTEHPQSHTERTPRRNWKWWLRWIFASYGIAVGALIVLIVCSSIVIGPPRTTDIVLENADDIVLVLWIIGGIVSYRYLK